MAQTGKVPSTQASPTPRAFGKGRMTEPASEAGAEPQEELLPVIFAPAACSSPGEVRFANEGRRLADDANCEVEAAPTGKALSSPASRRAFGELPPRLMAVVASEAGGEPQEEEELLSIIRNPTACSSDGKGRFCNLSRRLASLRAAAYAAEAELNAMKRDAVELEKELLVYPNLSQAGIASAHIQALELQDVKEHDYRNETIYGFDALDLITRTFKQISLESTDCYMSRQLSAHGAAGSHSASQQLVFPQDASYKHGIMESEGSLKDLACRVENIRSEFDAIKEEHAEVTVATPKDKNMMQFDQSVCKKSNKIYKSHFLSTCPTSEDTQGPSGLPTLNGEHERENKTTMESGLSLTDLVDKETNIRGKDFKNKCFESDGSSSMSSNHSDFEDEILNLLTESSFRQKKSALQVIQRENECGYRHMPAEDFFLPEVSSLDLKLQFPCNLKMSGITTTTTTSSSSSSSMKNQTQLDNHDDSYSDRGSIGIASDEEEELLMAEVSICVADDLEAIELIIRHDEEEVLSQLGMMAPVRSNGAPRKFLLEQRIVFFAKEKAVTTCSVCINEFETTDRCIRLPCRHIFHFKCIIRWLLVKSTCPVCRGSLSNSDDSSASPASVQLTVDLVTSSPT